MNVLLNLDNFNEDFIKPYLKDYINRKMRVLIIPFSFHEDYIKTPEDWNSEFSNQRGEAYEKLVAPFLDYGIIEDNIVFLNYFLDNRDTARIKIKNSDIIYFQGGYPDKLMKRLEQFNIIEELQDYKGVVMGASAGAMIQFREYHLTPDDDYYEYDYYNGLGYIDDFEIEVHYRNILEQRNSMRRYFSERKKKIYAVGNEGAIVLNNGKIKTFGDVTLYNNTLELENIKIITGEKTYLRDLNQDDINTIWESSNEIKESINRIYFPTIESIEDMVNRKDIITNSFGIMDMKTDEFVGYIVIKKREYETFDIHLNIFVKYEDYGFATDAGHVLLDYIFGNHDIRRVETSINYVDDKINKLLFSLGFKQEACFKSKVLKGNTYFDEFIYTVLKEEYMEISKNRNIGYDFGDMVKAIENGHDIELIYNFHKYIIGWDMSRNLLFVDKNSGNYFIYNDLEQLISSVEIEGNNIYDLIENKMITDIEIKDL